MVSGKAEVCAVCDTLMFDGSFGLRPEDAEGVKEKIPYRDLQVIPGEEFEGLRTSHHAACVQNGEGLIMYDAVLKYDDGKGGLSTFNGLELRDGCLDRLVNDPGSCGLRTEGRPTLR